jgi:hypothetical protein
VIDLIENEEDEKVEERRQLSVTDIVGPAGAEIVDKLVPEYNDWSAPGSPQHSPADTPSSFGRRELNPSVSVSAKVCLVQITAFANITFQRLSQHTPKQRKPFAESMSNLDGRRRSGKTKCPSLNEYSTDHHRMQHLQT